MTGYVFCNQCGHRNPPSSSFCSSCGSALDVLDDRTINLTRVDPLQDAPGPDDDVVGQLGPNAVEGECVPDIRLQVLGRIVVSDGVAEIPIEERDAAEVTCITGALDDGSSAEVRLTPEGVSARNFAFDVTPARLITGLITERGICAAGRAGLESLYPEHG